jgi:hypothetical protein
VEPQGVEDFALTGGILVIFSSLVLLVNRSRRLSLGIVGFTLLVFLVAIWRFQPWAFLPLAGDDGFYFTWGAQIADVLEGEGNDSGMRIWPGKGVWPVVIALTHLLVEDAFLAPLAIASIASLSTILFLNRATHLIIGHSPPLVLAFLILLQPAFLGWGPTLNREAFFWLGTALLVLGFAYYIRESYLKSLVSGLAGALFVIGMRFEVGIPVAYLMLCATLVFFVSHPSAGMTGQRFRKWLVVSLVWAISTLVTALGFLWARNPALFSLIPLAAEAEPGSLAAEAEELYMRNEVNRAYLGRDEVTTAFKVSEDPILGVIEGGFRAIFGPFPSEMGLSLVWWISALSTLNFLLVLGLAMVFVISLRSRFLEYSGLALAALGCIFIIAFSITNYGMVMRFRFVPQILLVPLAIGGYLLLRRKFAEFRSERKNQRPASAT